MRKLVVILLLYFICSCAGSVNHRINYAEQLASQHSFQKEIIKTDSFSLLTYSKISQPKSTLNIYIEGDGFAWRNRYTVSYNPTPKNPVSLKLAITDPNANILYIARPCQYVDLEADKMCNSKFWTNARFAKSVIESTNHVIDAFVSKHGFKKVHVFGYSGGAAVAVLAASMRDDVALIGTVAGNLNHKELMRLHEVSPLDESLDAIDVVDEVKHIQQFHLIGAKDRIVMPKVIMSFAMRVNLLGGKAKFKIIDEADHQYEKWPEVWRGVFGK